jgi:hypothetical protein
MISWKGAAIATVAMDATKIKKDFMSSKCSKYNTIPILKNACSEQVCSNDSTSGCLLSIRLLERPEMKYIKVICTIL